MNNQTSGDSAFSINCNSGKCNGSFTCKQYESGFINAGIINSSNSSITDSFYIKSISTTGQVTYISARMMGVQINH